MRKCAKKYLHGLKSENIPEELYFMDNSGFISVGILAVLLIMSAYFSATETAFSSLNKIRLKSTAANANIRAQLVLKIAEDYDKLLSTILIGNNIVNIASASLATVIFVEHFGEAGITISTAVMTVLVLIFGEISPKSLAKEAPESFAMFSAPFLNFMTVILTPVNFLFSLWKKMLAKIFKIDNDHKITQDELLVLVDEVTQEGGIDEDEGRLLRSALEFTDRSAENIITPRIDLEAVPLDASKEEIAKSFSESRFSRILVYKEDIDHIVGIIHQKDFYTLTGITKKSVKDIMTEPVFVPKSIKIDDLLKILQKNKSHIAVVSDEYGGTLGIVTMEDILEELVGEIWDEHDDVVETFTKIADNRYKVVCSGDLDSLYKFFDINKDAESITIGGWVMEQLGRIPNEGDTFKYENLDVTVTGTDYRRVLEIEVYRNPENLEEE